MLCAQISGMLSDNGELAVSWSTLQLLYTFQLCACWYCSFVFRILGLLKVIILMWCNCCTPVESQRMRWDATSINNLQLVSWDQSFQFLVSSDWGKFLRILANRKMLYRVLVEWLVSNFPSSTRHKCVYGMFIRFSIVCFMFTTVITVFSFCSSGRQDRPHASQYQRSYWCGTASPLHWGPGRPNGQGET